MDWGDQIEGYVKSYGPKMVGALIAIAIGFWIANRLVHLFSLFLKKRKVDPTLKPALAMTLDIILKALVLLSVAGLFGLPTASFIAIFSAIAFAIGMALQGNLGHIASGIMLLLFRPFRVGDYVDIQGHRGTVEEVNLFMTKLLTLENKRVFLPNGMVTSGPIINVTGPGRLKVFLTFSIAYSADIDRAREIILQTATTCKKILPDEEVEVFVSKLNDSSVDFAVRPWCRSKDYWDVYFYMTEHVKKAFDAAGISIPFPQMDVHLKKEVTV